MRSSGASKDNVPHPPDNSEDRGDLPRNIIRFAQYTAPIMLAMLASAGKDTALADCSPCL